MGKHRSRLEILADILSVMRDYSCARKTKIMYQAYLSHVQLVRYLNDVIDAGLVVRVEEKCYTLTLKGEKFLAKLDEYVKCHESVYEQVNGVYAKRLMLEDMCPQVTKNESNVS
jgi:predicted transcriptional regulator